jgi:hypothetical protein
LASPSVLAWRVRRQGLAERAPADEALAVAARIGGLHAQLLSSAELTLHAQVDDLDPAQRGRSHGTIPVMKPATILSPRLKELIAEGAQLVEVLPPEEYAELHLPGAVSIPLKTLDAETTAQLDRRRAVIVYCWDGL